MDVEMKIQEYAHRHMSMRVQSLLLENKELINQLTKQKLENFIRINIRRENSEL